MGKAECWGVDEWVGGSDGLWKVGGRMTGRYHVTSSSRDENPFFKKIAFALLLFLAQVDRVRRDCRPPERRGKRASFRARKQKNKCR